MFLLSSMDHCSSFVHYRLLLSSAFWERKWNGCWSRISQAKSSNSQLVYLFHFSVFNHLKSNLNHDHMCSGDAAKLVVKRTQIQQRFGQTSSLKLVGTIPIFWLCDFTMVPLRHRQVLRIHSVLLNILVPAWGSLLIIVCPFGSRPKQWKTECVKEIGESIRGK